MGIQRLKAAGLFSLAVVLLVFCGCTGREPLLAVEDVLPPGYREAGVPRDIVDEMLLTAEDDIGWIRCIDCGMDWQELNRHINTAVRAHGYSDTTDRWLPVMMSDGDLDEDLARQLFKVYSSSSGYGHIFVMNLIYIKTTYNASVGTGGDFLITVGYDHLDRYKTD